MADTTINELIAFFSRQLLDDGIRVDRLILFGSHALDQNSPDSDIDLAVISSDFEGKDMVERAKMTQNVEVSTIRTFLMPLDIITLTPLELESESSLIAAYVRKGKTVFAA